MINGWLIYSKLDSIENKAYIDWFIEEAKKQELILQLVLREDITIGVLENNLTLLYKNKKTELPNFAVVRTVEPLLNLQLEQLGIKVFNSFRTSEICNHKAKTYFTVAQLGIPMMNTFFIKGTNLNKVAPMQYPFVIKEAMGRGGKQVYFINNVDEWSNFLTSARTVDYVAQSTNVKLGKDLRVFVVGKEIIGAVLRESNTDFRANFTLGGSARLYELNTAEVTLIQRIINHFDFGMVGIDFLIGFDNKLRFNEIEDVAGSRTLSAVSDVNLVEKYVSYIKTIINQDS
ncbi:ATP-grasp domain-containing protein [Paucisalibacillus globulus]|uniref:ATP-grasp domain-containing protein n=1 Tax=Paucisalibacillus globulus TaxID=351095 RepID=UPI0004034E03|nr:hypothetical protein [Paucisalibacillus globulus]